MVGFATASSLWLFQNCHCQNGPEVHIGLGKAVRPVAYKLSWLCQIGSNTNTGSGTGTGTGTCTGINTRTSTITSTNTTSTSTSPSTSTSTRTGPNTSALILQY